MRPIIDAVESLFSSAVMSGGDVADAATFVMENVDWSSSLNKMEARSLPVVDDSLEELCDYSGQYGSNAHIITDALRKSKDDIRWNTAFSDWTDPDIEAYSPRFAWCSLIGEHAPLASNSVEAGLSIQGRDTYYPPHAHQAVETYWIIGGDADWKVGVDPWFPVEPGATIHHESGIRHAMQTNRLPLLALWLWTSHLDSSLVIVRG